MILSIVLLLSYGILVSSNNGYPIIPAQTYPMYQQNGYLNPSASQSSDIIPYVQNLMVQNQSPSLNLSPSSIKQILLNRILSGQPILTIFDQNPRGYSSNSVDFPNNAIVPNAVNNYFAAPMVNEYLNNQSNSPNKEDKAAEINKTDEKRKKHKKRKPLKSKRNKDESENNNVNTQDNDRETSKKSRKRTRKPKTDPRDPRSNNKENEPNKKTKKKKRKNKENEENNSIDEETTVEKPKTRRRHKKKPKTDNDTTEKVTLEQHTTPNPKQIQEGINLVHFNEGIVEENRVPRNPIPEVNELLKTIPNLPDNVASSFNFKALPQFNNPAMSNFFTNYENIYQTMMANNKGNEQREIKRRRPQKSKINNKRKVEVKTRNSTATEGSALSNSKPKVTPKVNVVTTEKTIYIKEKTRTNIDPILKDGGSKPTDRPSEEKETIVNEFDMKEIEVKDIESNINEPIVNYGYGYIDDYYPQFADSAAYTANNREVYINNLGDTKYYYAVDKRNPAFINRLRFEGFGLPERVIKDYEVNKKYIDAEKEGFENVQKTEPKDINEEVIQFRTPPQLESPDFQTRKVEKSEINREPWYNFDEKEDFDPRFLGDKASIYSKAKIPFYVGNKKKDNSKKVLKDKQKDVETVCARSKVVNYGPVYNPREDTDITETSPQILTEDSYFNNGGTTYVLATSLDYPETYW